MQGCEDKIDYVLSVFIIIDERDTFTLCSANYNLGLGCIPIS